ncbi:MAG: hypothetical protein QGG36_09630 [Pirellulaceae bacterium]|jgi:hypothetical protein|nr:hypothetical protein [Pirellulaceae bacterium]
MAPTTQQKTTQQETTQRDSHAALLAANVPATKRRLPLAITVSKTKGGPPLESRRLDNSELMEFEAEAWHVTVLRKGQPGVLLEQVGTLMEADFERGQEGALQGFSIRVTDPLGKQHRCQFTREAVSHQVTQVVHQLAASGALELDDEYYFELTVADECELETATSQESPETGAPETGVSIKTHSAPLSYLVHDLAPLLRQSKVIGRHHGDVAHLFYVQEAFEKAKQFARRGGNEQPPLETGCILIGALVSCPRTGEFFVVVVDVLEAQDADSNKFSLEFSGKTWTRMQTILRARQARTPALRFVGQAHGHPFPPLGGAPPCEICSQQQECTRHTCFVSVDDVNWTRAVFPRQPWQICHIFGINARDEHVNKLFAQRNGQLLERSYRLLPEFDLQAATPAARS